jgi:TQO small subunit DoxD
MLMAGAPTRVAVLVSIGFSVLLMAMFGRQGATCIDEWTMAACNLAMGATLPLAGSGACSVDNILIRRNPVLATKPWFRWMAGSLPLPLDATGFRKVAFAVLAFVLVFDSGTYSYYRGSVVTPFHGVPVSPTKHHLALSDATLLPDGGVRFHVYPDAGTPEAPVHVVGADLLGADKQSTGHCDAAALSALPETLPSRPPTFGHCTGIPLGENRTGGGTSTSGLKPPLPVSVAASGMAASLYAAPGTGDVDAGRVGVVVTVEMVGLQAPIIVDVPNAEATGPVPPRGVMLEPKNEGGAAGLIDEDGSAEAGTTGDMTTGDVVTGNVADGDAREGEVINGEVVSGEFSKGEPPNAGQVDPAALMPLIGHVVMLPNAGVCGWPRLPT